MPFVVSQVCNKCVTNRTQWGQLGHVILWISLYDFVHFVLYMFCAWPSKVELSVARGVLALDEPTSGQPPNIRAECRSKNGQRCKKKTVALPHLSNRFILHETLVLQLFQYFNVF